MGKYQSSGVFVWIFVYGAIRSGARAKEFETAIQWLADAGIVHKMSLIRKAILSPQSLRLRDYFVLLSRLDFFGMHHLD